MNKHLNGDTKGHDKHLNGDTKGHDKHSNEDSKGHNKTSVTSREVNTKDLQIVASSQIILS